MTLRSLLAATALTIALCALAAFTAPRAEAAGPNPVVIMETDMGRIIIMLYPKDAPITVKNFLQYVDSGFYDNTLFHRVVRERKSAGEDDTSMNIIQGGGYTYPMNRKQPNPPIPNEAASGLQNNKGTIAMARGNAPDSATCEFFINVEDNPVLNPTQSVKQLGTNSYQSSSTAGYCAFGKVIRGMNVVEKIHQVDTGRQGRMEDVPRKPIRILKAYRAK